MSIVKPLKWEEKHGDWVAGYYSIAQDGMGHYARSQRFTLCFGRRFIASSHAKNAVAVLKKKAHNHHEAYIRLYTDGVVL